MTPEEGRTLLEQLTEWAVEHRAAAERGPSVRVEFAARVAELANTHRTHDVHAGSEEFLDGYVAGFERAAELIRELAMIPMLK